MSTDNWNGQNIPNIHKEIDGATVSILPVLECFLKYDEDIICDLLPSKNSYGWNDSLLNSMAWANNAYRVVDFIPDFSRYGSLPAWFPTTDSQDHRLTEQGQVDRFLFLLDLAYGGLPDNHREVDAPSLAQAVLELKDNFGEFVDIEQGDQMKWEVEKE